MAQFRWLLLFFTLIVVSLWLFFFGRRLPRLLFGKPQVTQSFPSVLGNSMAPTLFGAHHVTRCPHCGHVNRFVAESFPAPLYFCGRCRDELKDPKFESRPGDEVHILPADPLKRWDIVLVRDPTESLRIIKRLVAFPGEKLQIKLGDLWVDGQRIERSLDQILESRLELFAEEFTSTQPPKPIAAQAAASPVGWRRVSAESSVAPTEELADTTHLEFAYREPWNKSIDPQTRNRFDASIVSDWYPENPAFSGSLWPVGDQILELCFIPEAKGQLRVSLRDPILHSPHTLALPDWTSNWSTNSWSCGENINSVNQREDHETCLRYIFAYVDGAYWLRVHSGYLDRSAHQAESSATDVGKGDFVAEQVLVEWKKIPEELNDPKLQPCATDVVWAMQYSGVQRWLYRRESRDIYYRRDTWSETRGLPMIRHLTGYYLLGDNQPISLDSRQKAGWIEGVPREWIEGRISPPK
jgi:hypothetical protein